MKKLLAIVVALMMLVAVTASAETVIKIADPVMVVNLEEAQTIDLTGLVISIAGGLVDEIPAARVEILNGDQLLLGFDANIADKVLLTIDGVSGVYSVAIPEQAASVASLDLSGLDIDLDALMSSVMDAVEIDGNTIRIPYTAVNEILEAIAPAVEKLEVPGADLSGFADAIADMKANNSGITLEGTYEETDDGFSLAASLIPVQNGEAADEAAKLSVNMDGDSITAKVEVPGQATFAFTMVPTDDDMLLVTINVEAEGQNVELKFKLSSTEADVTLKALDGSNAIDLQNMTDEQQQQFMGELYQAAGGLLGFAMSVLPADLVA